MAHIDLIGQSFELKQKNLSSQRTINYILKQVNDAGVKSPKFLAPTPGAVIQHTVSTDLADCRGLYYSSSGPASDNFISKLYGVWGNVVYRFNTALTAAYPIGNVTEGGNISMTDNGFDFVVVDGQGCWKYPLLAENNDAKTLVSVLLPDAAGIVPATPIRPTHIAFLAQRLIVNSQAGNQWYFTDLPTETDSVVFHPDNFYSAESSSDVIQGLMVSNGSLWIYGYRSYEIWRGTGGNQDDPFNFVGGSQSSVGIVGIGSLATINNYIFWLGGSDVGAAGVYMGNSTSAERISNPAIEDQIGSIKDQTAAIAWAYASKGYMYYVLSFPNVDRTFVYETVTGTWTERLQRDVNTSAWKVWPYQFGCFVNGQIVCGLVGKNTHPAHLVKLDDDVYTEYNGDVVVRQRTTQVYFEDFNLVKGTELVVDCEVGTTALLTGQGSDPKIQLEISRDGGNSYGNILDKSLGQQGNYRKIVRWNGLGTSRAYTFRLTVAENCPCAIYSGRFTYEPCSRT